MTELYHQIYSQSDRILLILWTVFCTIIGAIGNSIIIFTAMFFHPSSKLDKHTKILIRQLALSDLLYIILRIIPSLVSHLTQGWVLGDTFCKFEGTAYLIPVLTSMHLILGLNLFKVTACLKPFIIQKLPIRLTCGVVMGCWASSCIVPLLAYIFGVEVEVNPLIETVCEPKFHGSPNTSRAGYAVGVFHNIQIWLPASLILPCNVILWCLAHRHASSHHISSRKAMATVLSISLLFLVTWVPTIVEEGWRQFAGLDPIPMWFNKVHINFYFISAFGNPMLYALVNRRYRNETLRHFHVSRGNLSPYPLSPVRHFSPARPSSHVQRKKERHSFNLSARTI